MSYTNRTDSKGREHVPVQNARAAEKTGRVRIILAVSFIVAIIAMAVIIFVFAHPGAQPPTAQ
jgi:hypothetical protein